MAEDNNIVLATREQGLGDVSIAPEVIEVIIGIATSQVEGVYSMRGSLKNSLSELLGKKNRGRGVKLENGDNGLNVDVYVFLNYGVAVPQVAREIQDKVRQQVLFMTGLEISGVDVHICGVIPEKEQPAIDPNNPFGVEDGEQN
ncbi:Uncharacterized conserved protein YloU, alkaline shock protein (Asp23) family [Ligilactobacillus sp. WC1T17]|uniref:Uncharacterized conserved protein YloU, alkaline shock protein (Asp23) family n=1 Tax=Ligilactobacillus ruminis TaxID=1623 RepID=A0ABY1A9J3_9LACO|nr:Uncharacterized conserved protein YloU, alkaline shock protein (Asp23) family [Ligilactobacillus ruminis]